MHPKQKSWHFTQWQKYCHFMNKNNEKNLGVCRHIQIPFQQTQAKYTAKLLRRLTKHFYSASSLHIHGMNRIHFSFNHLLYMMRLAVA